MEEFGIRLVGGPYGISEDEGVAYPFADYMVREDFSWPLDEEIKARAQDGSIRTDGSYVKVSESKTARNDLRPGELRGAVYQWKLHDGESEGMFL